MDDLQLGYSLLSREAEMAVLPAPADVRRRADRRTRVRTAVAVTAVLLLVAGITVGSAWALSPDRGTSPAPAESLTDAPTPSTTNTPPAPSPSPSRESPSTVPPATTRSPAGNPPTSIPDRAFLQASDVESDLPTTTSPDKMLPNLCGRKYGSDGSVQVRRTMNMLYWRNKQPGHTPDGSFSQTITTYRAGGAEAFMDQLRDAVGDCPARTVEGLTYKHRLLTAEPRGDEAVLFEVTYPTRDNENNLTGGTDLRLVSVVRVGSVVMVLYETGYERGWSADREDFDYFVTKAMSRLESWLN